MPLLQPSIIHRSLDMSRIQDSLPATPSKTATPKAVTLKELKTYATSYFAHSFLKLPPVDSLRFEQLTPEAGRDVSPYADMRLFLGYVDTEFDVNPGDDELEIKVWSYLHKNGYNICYEIEGIWPPQPFSDIKEDRDIDFLKPFQYALVPSACFGSASGNWRPLETLIRYFFMRRA